MTDKTSDTPNGIGADLGEPSMEDILASIRRIIAEDDVADQGHIDALGQVGAASEAVAQAKDIDIVPDSEDILLLNDLVQDVKDSDQGIANSNELELDTVLDDLDIGDVETEEFNPVSSVMSDLEGKLAEDRSEVPDLQEVFDAQEITGIEAPVPKVVGDDDDALLEIMGNLDLAEDRSGIEMVLSDEVMQDVADAERNLKDPLEGIVEFGVTEESNEDDGLTSDLVEGLSTEESDLDIVKSLMADLTDTSFLDLDDDVETPEVEIEAAGVTIEEPDIEDMSIFDEIENIANESDAANKQEIPTELVISEEDEIISDILDLTLQDEEALSLDSLELTIDDEPSIVEPVSNGVDDGSSLLLQIAAAAEADAGQGMTAEEAVVPPASIANEVDDLAAEQADLVIPDFEDDLVQDLLEPEGPSTEELLSELDLALAEVTQEDNQEVDEVSDIVSEAKQELALDTEFAVEDIEAADPETEIVETEDLFVDPQETEDMAKTARKNAIINEVTEEATSDAFAELTKAVDDKAVYTESGPRVGDIVQDALRPMLKEWLDDNLKGIVERAVAKEVKRISSGK